MAEQVHLEGRLYLIRHGEHNSEGVKRLDEKGRKNLVSLAEKLKPELKDIKPHNFSFFSTGYLRAVESAIELVQIFGDEYSQINTSHLLYDAENCKQFFDEHLANLGKEDIVFAICHLPFVEHFPAWFFNNLHKKPGRFEGEYGPEKGTGIYIDFRTGEHRELTFRNPPS